MKRRRTMHLGASPGIFRMAFHLRKNQTKAERILWEYLRNRQMEGCKFRRQHSMDRYVLDFYCNELILGIEADGEYHEDPVQKFYDDDRTENLENQDVRILRFPNEMIYHHVEEVLFKIRSVIIEMKSLINKSK